MTIIFKKNLHRKDKKMKKNKKKRYTMDDEDLKALKRTIEYVKKLDLFDKSKEEIKPKKLNKVA